MAPVAPGFPDALRARWAPIRILGGGGMGIVWLAEDRELGRLAAIKLVRGTSDPRLAVRLEREAVVMARLSHPNVAKVFESGRTPEGPYLVCEYVKGAPLGDGLPVGTEPMAAMLQAAEGLDAIHAAGLVHRDVKLQNMLLDDEGRVVLIDFGLALDASVTRLTETGQVVGTVTTLAPEVLRGLEAGPPADWYAWGVCLFRLYTGRYPYEMEGIQAMIAGPPPPVDWGARKPSPRVVEVVEACLAREPGERPAGLAALRARLEGRAAPAPAGARAPGPSGAARVSAALPALPRAGGPGRFGWGVLAGLGLAGALAWRGAGAGPGPSPPAAAPVAAAGKDPSEPGFAAGAVAELEEARGAETQVGAGMVPVLDRDFAAWGRVVRAVPGLDAFYAWLARGGRPEALEPAPRLELGELDARCLQLGLPRVATPFLAASPAPGAVEVTARAREFLPPGARGAYSGWAGTAVLYADRMAARLAAQDRELSTSKGLLPGGIDPAGMRLVFDIGGIDSRKFVEEVAGQRPLRVALREWVAEGSEALATAVYAGMRSLREEPATRDEIAKLVSDGAFRCRALFFGPTGFLPPGALLGGEPDSLAGIGAAAEVVNLMARVHQAARVPCDELARYEERLWRAWRGWRDREGLGSGPVAGATYQVLRAREETAAPAAMRSRLDELWPRLADVNDETEGQILMIFGRALEDDPGRLGLPRARVLELAERLGALVPSLPADQRGIASRMRTALRDRF